MHRIFGKYVNNPCNYYVRWVKRGEFKSAKQFVTQFDKSIKENK